MTNMTIKQNRGFSLVELMVAIIVTSFLLMAIYLAVNTTQRDSVAIERTVTVQADAKSALDIMALEIGMASYTANYFADNWIVVTAAGCEISPNQDRRGISLATPSQIVVAMDADDSCNVAAPGNCIGDAPNEVIRYNYVIDVDDAGGGHITRSTGCLGVPAPFLGEALATATANNRSRNVRVNNAELGISLFRYFDNAAIEIVGAGTDGALTGTQIPNIRRIDITLAVETADADHRGTRQQLFYSTTVIPRNHAINF
jgi:prepilin-type N-terminal cleavage/methylation domain-containing protein